MFSKNKSSTGRMGWMAHRKWKAIKQQPSMLPGPAVPGSCLASFLFRWAIHPIRPVWVTNKKMFQIRQFFYRKKGVLYPVFTVLVKNSNQLVGKKLSSSVFDKFASKRGPECPLPRPSCRSNSRTRARWGRWPATWRTTSTATGMPDCHDSHDSPPNSWLPAVKLLSRSMGHFNTTRGGCARFC